jgi:pimeloyl-ACP methyl ester carboxylesterase
MRLKRAAASSLAIAVIAAIGVVALAAWWRYTPRTLIVTAGQFPEQLVFVQSSDDIVNGGVMFAPPKASAKPVAVIWIHGWGVNFYSPTYVVIGRALAARDITTITANTRMHDIGTSAAERRGRRIRGGGYWGVASEEVRDVQAWIDFAEQQGFARIVLVGHSAGCHEIAKLKAGFALLDWCRVWANAPPSDTPDQN